MKAIVNVGWLTIGAGAVFGSAGAGVLGRVDGLKENWLDHLGAKLLRGAARSRRRVRRAAAAAGEMFCPREDQQALSAEPEQRVDDEEYLRYAQELLKYVEGRLKLSDDNARKIRQKLEQNETNRDKEWMSEMFELERLLAAAEKELKTSRDGQEIAQEIAEAQEIAQVQAQDEAQTDEVQVQAQDEVQDEVQVQAQDEIAQVQARYRSISKRLTDVSERMNSDRPIRHIVHLHENRVRIESCARKLKGYEQDLKTRLPELKDPER